MHVFFRIIFTYLVILLHLLTNNTILSLDPFFFSLIGETVEEGQQQDVAAEDSLIEDVKNLTTGDDSVDEDDESNDEEDQEDGEEVGESEDEESGKKITHLSYKGGSRCIY